MVPNATSIERATEDDDRSGTDYLATLTTGSAPTSSSVPGPLITVLVGHHYSTN